MYNPLGIHQTIFQLRASARHYGSGFWRTYRRAHQFHARSLFSVSEMCKWGLLDPKIPGEAVAYYISKELRTRLEVGLNSRKYGDYFGDKQGFYQALEEKGLPHPRTYGTVKPPIDEESYAHRQRWIRIFDQLPEGPLIFKPVDGSRGSGIWASTRRDGRFVVGNSSLSSSDLYQRILGNLDTGLVVQEQVHSHPEIVELSGAEALQTLRIVTLSLDDSSPQPLYALLKFGAPESLVDNFHLGEFGKVLADIDLDTGLIRCAYGKMSQDSIGLIRHSCHPLTGRALEGARIPFWNEALELVRFAGSALPPVATVGWDIGITRSGPVIVEANTEWEPMPIAPIQGREREALWGQVRRRWVDPGN